MEPETTDATESQRSLLTGRGRQIISTLARITLAVGVFALVVTLATATSPYALLSPGPVPDLTNHTNGDIANPQFNARGSGQFSVVTVSVTPLSWISYFLAEVSGRSEGIYPVSEQGGAEAAWSNAVEVNDEGVAQMMQAQNTAAAIAAAATDDANITPRGVLITAVAQSSLAANGGVLPGDLVTEVAGIPSMTIAAYDRAVTEALASGVPFDIRVTRAGTRGVLHVSPVPGAHSLGVTVSQYYANPKHLSVSLPGVGGPSGGLLLTLNFLDALNEGDLAAGEHVTGTGTILANGSVGNVGGVAEKVVGARRAGARLFFVPVGDALVAKQHAPAGLTIVPVDNVGQAVVWLCHHGAASRACSGEWLRAI